MLVNMNEVLLPARKGKYGIGMFNAVNLEMARGIIAAAEQASSPVIMGTAEVFFSYCPLEEAAYYLIPMAKKAKVPVAIHLDHGMTEDACAKALELGFTSIMYDCSLESYDVNVRKVKEMAKLAHSFGATIEGELGHVGDNEGSYEGEHATEDPSVLFTDPKIAKNFVDQTGIDALAIAVGTAHGAYKRPPMLDFERIETIYRTTSVPLVLHGGSGLSDSDFKKAIRSGISKVNIFTDINTAAVEAMFRHFSSFNKGMIDLIPATVESIKENVMEKMDLFDSYNKA
ncbi:class II fructose-bisphosphate aldolase [Paenibacillus graminis]|uniref:Fructose-bisphosphate aldolase n=1 Tax=Paenibacillus graminis TaxID=189425 RepID=A0A089MAH6_9BACL|nr:class II fructose-bisphosphate aldolase [Paenibacillus graminis]AIQ70282.1 fructose-bisphosphate aldolase [Paenibacillus graminis]